MPNIHTKQPFDPQEKHDLTAFEPTDTLPGSAARLRVIAQRIEDGYPSEHPNDRRNDGVTGGPTRPDAYGYRVKSDLLPAALRKVSSRNHWRKSYGESHD